MTDDARLFTTGGRLAIIGVGNVDRRDDGAGLIAVRRLRMLTLPASIAVIEQTGEGAALIESWRGFDSVILIDAVRAGGAPGRIHRLDVSAGSLPSDFFHYSTHAFGVAEAIELARILGDLPAVLGIEGADFRPGCVLTTEVEAAVTVLVREVGSRLLLRLV
jgi:hydrogenase maturation protease